MLRRVFDRADVVHLDECGCADTGGAGCGW